MTTEALVVYTEKMKPVVKKLKTDAPLLVNMIIDYQFRCIGFERGCFCNSCQMHQHLNHILELIAELPDEP